MKIVGTIIAIFIILIVAGLAVVGLESLENNVQTIINIIFVSSAVTLYILMKVDK